MTTPILDLDEWEEAQAQPQITVNEAVRWLECFAQLVVASQSVTDPPSAADGDRYIVGVGATGEWDGHDGEIALAMGNAWAFREAPEGAVAYVDDEEASFRYLEGVWIEETGGEIESGGGGDPIPQRYSYFVEFAAGDTRQPTYRVPADSTVIAWTIHAEGGPGDCVIDVWRNDMGVDTPPPDNTYTIAGAGDEPALSSESDAGRTDLSTDWNIVDLNANDVIRFVLVSSSTVTRIYFQLDLEFKLPP